jgi:hypothetical protein
MIENLLARTVSHLDGPLLSSLDKTDEDRLRRASDPHWDLRLISGADCRTFERLHVELIRVLELPGHTGHNWNAMSDSIRDMSWSEDKARVLVVTSALDLLESEPTAELGYFLHIVRRAMAELGEPVEEGEWWDRGPLTFRCVLLEQSAKLEALRARVASATEATNFQTE